MSILQVQGLVKSFSGRKVVNGVSFEVNEGELVGLLGPNGAGKTTSFRMTCGLLTPDAGQVILNGEDVTRWPMYKRARDGKMGYLPQQSSVFARLSTQQNLLAMMELLGMPWRQRRERCAELLEEFDITKIRKSKAGALSGGERRRLEIARCLVSDPKIIMLDEPFAGIDPVTVQSIQQIIRRLCDQGIAILITDHAAREILQITERTYVVSEGRILCSGSAAEIIQHPEVKEKYLGEIDGVEIEEKRRGKFRVGSAAGKARSSSAPITVHSSGSGQSADPSERTRIDPPIHSSSNPTTEPDAPRESESDAAPRRTAPFGRRRSLLSSRKSLLRKSDLD